MATLHILTLSLATDRMFLDHRHAAVVLLRPRRGIQVLWNHTTVQFERDCQQVANIIPQINVAFSKIIHRSN